VVFFDHIFTPVTDTDSSFGREFKVRFRREQVDNDGGLKTLKQLFQRPLYLIT